MHQRKNTPRSAFRQSIEDIYAFLIESTMTIICGQGKVVIHISAHQKSQSLGNFAGLNLFPLCYMDEIAFMVRAKIGNIERSCLQRKLHCRLHLTQFAQEDGFEMTSFIIMDIARKRSLNEFQCIRVPVL